MHRHGTALKYRLVAWVNYHYGVVYVLNRRRALTLPMIRALGRLLDLSADVLVQAYQLKRTMGHAFPG